MLICCTRVDAWLTRASKQLRWNEPVYFSFSNSFNVLLGGKYFWLDWFSGISKFGDQKKGGECGLVLWLAMLSEAFHIYVFQLKMASLLFLDPLFSYFFVSVRMSRFEI